MRFGASIVIVLLLLGCEAPESNRSSGVDRTPGPAEPSMREDSLFRHRHESMLASPGRDRAELVFLGDSILRRFLAAGRKTWRERYAGRRVLNFAIEGDRTQNVLWRIEDGLFDGMSPRLVVLLIGTNNLDESGAEATALGVRRILRELQQRLPDSRVRVLGLLPRGSWTANDRLRRRVERTNILIAAYAAETGAEYRSLGGIFLTPSGEIDVSLLPDRLHPSAAGYVRLAAALAPDLDEILGNTPQIPEK